MIEIVVPEFISYPGKPDAKKSKKRSMVVCSNPSCSKRFYARTLVGDFLCTPIYYCSKTCIQFFGTAPITLIQPDQTRDVYCFWKGYTMNEIAQKSNIRVYLYDSPIDPSWTLARLIEYHKLQFECFDLELRKKKKFHTLAQLFKKQRVG